MNYRLRSMTTEHLDQVAALEKTCFSPPWSREMLAGELKNEAAAYLVAESGEGEVLGYAGMYVVLDEGHITNLAVHPALRRMGIATALLGAFLRFARANGLAFLTLEVREGNEAAITLYGRHLFRVAGRRKAYYDCPREDALIMTREF